MKNSEEYFAIKDKCMYENVKNVIFDVGSVLIGYNWHRVIKNFGYEHVKAFEAGYKMLDDVMWNNMDRGDVSFNELVDYYKNCYSDEIEMIDYFFEHKDEMAVYRPYLYKKIEELFEAGYNIYILSNYSDVLFESHTKEIPFLDKVHGKVISYSVNSVKPEPKIYDELLSQYDLDPAECLFFDDRKANIEAGEKFGIEGVIVNSEDDILLAIDELLKNSK